MQKFVKALLWNMKEAGDKKRQNFSSKSHKSVEPAQSSKEAKKLVIEGPGINLKETDRICIHALAPLLYYVVALREGIDPVKLGLVKEGNKIKHLFNASLPESHTQMAGRLCLRW